MFGARRPQVTLITPTENRPHSLRAVYGHLTAQKGCRWVWRIWDNSPTADGFFQNLSDPRVIYIHDPQPLTVGEKRNRLIAAATTDLIAHIDDDDYYAPRYLKAMTAALKPGADLVKLGAFYLYDVRARLLAYWDLDVREGWHLRLGEAELASVTIPEGRGEEAFGNNVWGYGFSYVYRRAIWQACPFEDVTHNEDGRFIEAAAAKGFGLTHRPDTRGLCLHLLHGSNASNAHAQYVLPPFMLVGTFGEAVVPFIQLMGTGDGAP